MRTHHANRFSTTLTAAMGATDLTASVLTTSGAPASPCYLVIDHDVPASAEIILFDGTFTGTTFTTSLLANRYLDGSAATSGLSHAVGAKVISAPLGTSLEDIWDDIETTQAGLDSHAAATTGVHGVGGSAVESTAGSQAKVDAHAADTTAVHGIADTSVLLVEADDSGRILGGSAPGSGSVAAGPSASATGGNSIAIGSGAAASGSQGIAIGSNTQATSGGVLLDSMAIGFLAKALHPESAAIGSGATTTASNQIRIGTGSDTVSIPGGLSVSGTKNFEIPHPLDDTRTVRHGCYEGPVPGGTIYRYRVTVTDGTTTVDLPDYFDALNTDVDVHVSPVKHFGAAYGEVDGNTLTVTANADGEYAVLILGTRNDTNAAQAWQVYQDTKPAGRMWNGRRPDELPAPAQK